MRPNALSALLIAAALCALSPTAGAKSPAPGHARRGGGSSGGIGGGSRNLISPGCPLSAGSPAEGKSEFIRSLQDFNDDAQAENEILKRCPTFNLDQAEWLWRQLKDLDPAQKSEIERIIRDPQIQADHTA